jgi:hypothetical protein
MEICWDSPWAPDAVLPRFASKASVDFMNENLGDQDQGADEYGYSDDSTL